MRYNKGPQLTVGTLKQYLSAIPDDVKIRVGWGDADAEARILLKVAGELVICPSCYGEDAGYINLKTIISFSK